MKFFFVLWLLLGVGSIISLLYFLCFTSLVSATGFYTEDEPLRAFKIFCLFVYLMSIVCKTVVHCRPLTAPEYGHVEPSECLHNPTYRTPCHYTCQQGYAVIGSQKKICSSSGEWSSNAVVVCKGAEQRFFHF